MSVGRQNGAKVVHKVRASNVLSGGGSGGGSALGSSARGASAGPGARGARSGRPIAPVWLGEPELAERFGAGVSEGARQALRKLANRRDYGRIEGVFADEVVPAVWRSQMGIEMWVKRGWTDEMAYRFWQTAHNLWQEFDDGVRSWQAVGDSMTAIEVQNVLWSHEVWLKARAWAASPAFHRGFWVGWHSVNKVKKQSMR